MHSAPCKLNSEWNVRITWNHGQSEDVAGDYAAWYMDGTAIAGGGIIGDSGAAWQLVKVADSYQDGKPDLVLEDGSGTYATRELDSVMIVVAECSARYSQTCT